jgi:predicted Zn-dependent protease
MKYVSVSHTCLVTSTPTIATADGTNGILFKVSQQVKRVGMRIVRAAGLEHEYTWEFVVIKSNVPNAFVLPGGKVCVFTGLLPIVKSESGLAAVLGHEVSHVIARMSTAARACLIR